MSYVTCRALFDAYLLTIKSTPITGLPTLLASTMSGLIVVGGVDDFGTQNPNSQTASYVKVSAPSTGIICASTNKDDPYVGVTGTSGGKYPPKKDIP